MDRFCLVLDLVESSLCPASNPIRKRKARPPTHTRFRLTVSELVWGAIGTKVRPCAGFLRAEHTGHRSVSRNLDLIEIGRKLKERGYALRLSLSSLMALTSSGPVVTSVGTIASVGTLRPRLAPPVRRTS